MSKKVVIYTRVSTKEQADNGTSLRDQKERLTKYSHNKGWEIIGYYEEDYSGKTFNRPSFNLFMNDLKSKKIRPDIFLVLCHDRFSRQGEFGLAMERTLREDFGVTVKFSDKEYDHNDPNNTILRYIDYAYPEQENAVKSIKVKRGMRQRMSEGKFPSKAPRGYNNVTIGKDKCIEPNEVAPLIQKAFEEVAKQLHPTSDVWQMMKKEGLKSSLSHFYVMLKNPVYMGKIVVKADEDEDKRLVDGLHQPLVSESLFHKVQDVLNGKKKPSLSKTKHKESVPLRRLIICSSCGKPFTASRSKGGSDIRYYYYHCQKKCKRYRADKMHDEFINILESFEIPEAFVTLYKEVLMDIVSRNQKTQKEKIKEADKRIQKYRDKLTDAEDKLLDEVLSDTAYKRIEERYSKAIDELLSQRVDFSLSLSPIEEYVESGLTLMADLPGFFTNADADTKSMMVSSIFPEKLEYNGKNYRTPKLNAFIAQTANYIKLYGESENEKASISESLSTEVAPTRIELVSKV